ncbi:MAG TPA: nitrite/sulfite reductase [Acidimicrobiia bacterium]|jgi:sulfite reductase beta subunit-like hemoprotein|nr:nitrite/sulfite reductase [Acidimicrobiia bacterium]
MAIDVRELATRTLDPVVAEELDIFEQTVTDYLDGRVDEDTFRVFRLNHGVYGQRQGGRNQMLRVKIPHGRLTAEQLDTFAYVAENYSRGWGHITTRQNMQFHFIQLEQSPEILRVLAAAGMTSREACGDTVRNVMGCHLAGACPQEHFDITPWAQATTDFLLRHPYAQRLPRKFKINFSGCETDCGQAMFNDVGVVASVRTRPDGSEEQGFRVFVAGGLSSNPKPAQALEEFTAKEDLLPTIYAVLRTFDHYGNRDNKIRARMKWLQESLEGGVDELRERIFKERKFLRGARDWPGGIPDIVKEMGDAPAGGSPTATKVGSDLAPVKLLSSDPYERWVEANVVRGIDRGTISAMAYSRIGDVTVAQFRGLADIQRDFNLDVRMTNRQNFALRDVQEADLRALYDRLSDIDMAQPGAELARDVVSCPGADTCNLAVTQSRGLAAAIGDRLEEEGLAEVPGVRVNISGCTNSCGQHHISDIGFFGLERRAHGRAAPGYQMLLGGHLANTEVKFGEKATKIPAKSAPEAVVRVVKQFNEEREAGETFQTWLARSGGASGVGATLKELDQFPTPDVGPDFYVDYDETGPYVADVGDGECAAT